MTKPTTPVRVDFHVGDDVNANGDLTCWISQRDKKHSLVEPIKVERKKNQDGIEFRLFNPKYRFVGFLSPQDRRHECFKVSSIYDEAGQSVMNIKDDFSATENLFDYELVFRKKGGSLGNLYRYDPQIKND